MDEIPAHILHAAHGKCWIIGLAVQVEDISHVIHKVAIGFFWEAPGFFEPGLQLVFLSVVRTVSGLMCSIYSSCTMRSASSRIVQRCLPSGAWLQATGIRCASPLPPRRLRSARSPAKLPQ